MGCLSITACGTSHADSPLGRVRTAGRLMIATDALYPPDEFKQGDRIVGFDIDLGTAIAKDLGVKAEFEDVKFDTILQALQDGKYDISISSFTDTAPRERHFDFVTYLSVGTMLIVPKGNPKRLRPDDLSLCGQRIAVEQGTIQEAELTRRDVTDPAAGKRLAACKVAHRPAPVRQSYDDQTAANDALLAGHADAVLTDAPSASYGARQSSGRIEPVGRPYATSLYGIVVPKRRGDLRNAIQSALKDLISNGGYRRLTDKWGISDSAVDEPRINAG